MRSRSVRQALLRERIDNRMLVPMRTLPLCLLLCLSTACGGADPPAPASGNEQATFCLDQTVSAACLPSNPSLLNVQLLATCQAAGMTAQRAAVCGPGSFTYPGSPCAMVALDPSCGGGMVACCPAGAVQTDRPIATCSDGFPAGGPGCYSELVNGRVYQCC